MVMTATAREQVILLVRADLVIYYGGIICLSGSFASNELFIEGLREKCGHFIQDLCQRINSHHYRHTKPLKELSYIL